MHIRKPCSSGRSNIRQLQRKEETPLPDRLPPFTEGFVQEPFAMESAEGTPCKTQNLKLLLLHKERMEEAEAEEEEEDGDTAN